MESKCTDRSLRHDCTWTHVGLGQRERTRPMCICNVFVSKRDVTILTSLCAWWCLQACSMRFGEMVSCTESIDKVTPHSTFNIFIYMKLSNSSFWCSLQLSFPPLSLLCAMCTVNYVCVLCLLCLCTVYYECYGAALNGGRSMDKLAARELLHLLIMTSILWCALWWQADDHGDEFLTLCWTCVRMSSRLWM